MKNGFAPNGPVNGFADQRLRAFVDDVVAPAYRERRAADRAEFFDRAYNDTMIGQGIQSMISGLTLPGDVAQGKFSMDDPRAIERVFDLASSVTLGAGAIPAPKSSLRAGIKAYHGSPHDFDEFSLSKIGTGEGAQAYGHGLYFADSEDVARNYKEVLADGFKIDGEPFNASTTKYGHTTPGHHAADALSRFKGDKDKAIEWLNGGGPVDIEAANMLQNSKTIEPWTGRMYEVEINANPDDFLDWDVPLKEQPENVQAFARNADLSKMNPGNRTRRILEAYRGEWEPDEGAVMPDATIRDLRAAVTGYGEDGAAHAQFSESLREAGIPGIKYLDGSSRAAGEGSRNYVVFDDSLIKILRKYGIAVPAGMAGYEMTRDQFNQYVADQQAQQYERDNNMTRMGML